MTDDPRTTVTHEPEARGEVPFFTGLVIACVVVLCIGIAVGWLLT